MNSRVVNSLRMNNLRVSVCRGGIYSRTVTRARRSQHEKAFVYNVINVPRTKAHDPRYVLERGKLTLILFSIGRSLYLAFNSRFLIYRLL